MNGRDKVMKFFFVSLSAVLVLTLSITTSWASDKKGVGLADLNASARITALNVAWYYTWKPQPIQGAPMEKFVPMIWGGRHFKDDLSAMHARGKVPALLGFNEPNMVQQANMSVDEAIRLWPQLESLADRLGSPAPSGILGPWFERFYGLVIRKGLKMDFMTVHIYGPPDAKRFLDKLDAVYKKYKLPIWITEFAVSDWKAKKPGTNPYSEEDVLAFMKAVLPELEKRSYVERYAWFGAGKYPNEHEQLRTSRLFEKDGTLTSLGIYYSKFR
jgi:hypothetical protein